MTAADLRAWRAAQGLSQRGLAEALGVSVRTLQEWEQGRRPGPGGAILELALQCLADQRARAERARLAHEAYEAREAERRRLYDEAGRKTVVEWCEDRRGR